MTYAAFLRGINVGGNVLIKMAELKTLLEKNNFQNVKTILASGNVVFEAPKGDARKLAQKIEAVLKTRYKRDIRVIVRPLHDIEMLAKADPFKGITVTKDTRLYVTFLDKAPKTHIKTHSENFRVVKTCPFAVCTVLTLTKDRGSLKLMDALAHYGPSITTRNWNTVQKVLKAAIQ